MSNRMMDIIKDLNILEICYNSMVCDLLKASLGYIVSINSTLEMILVTHCDLISQAQFSRF
jgi:hypothetical protein